MPSIQPTTYPSWAATSLSADKTQAAALWGISSSSEQQMLR
ncbi:molybdenum cofactor biosynthesis protein A [Haemophilus influenzae PittAA]|nr:molybdenum cofactor biosynthesis protein A [Haemophilus influenzae PittAA]